MKQVKRCPRFTTIRMASDGNNEAIEKILEHYNAYISKACLRPFYVWHNLTKSEQLNTILMQALSNK